jgi:hypothetical protein
VGGGGPGGGLGLERSTSSSFFAASNARLLRASSCNCLTSPSLSANKSRMGTPACSTLIQCGARRLKLSVLGRSRESLVVRNVSLDLFSFFGTVVRHRTFDGETPAQGTPSGVLHRNASTHSFSGRCICTIIVGIVPVIAVDLPPSSVPPRLGLVQQSFVGIPPSF